ncbi:N-acetylgalactosamine-N,N'-diacetylbacillosaminyl-diphospho-undecaprenol 4-alpha-N-acetylgalactosaminyltransferase [Bremerella volcania]|uniref:N-acetylgalactosamine-N, N'-diacetylbacillosaminyl-diphospho-undecaprenol 4-alpha-N-acetylgalactosaminyltransferase n=1 Tax=Bremerella volcania TaxID=2527984 RepID=A0A518CAL8_9BACT|nr:glycosyltransferase [Bremerella volcania]QDU76273.1 N-acetylgalactosamine-N,N'-diacetylbacillosaminyl-diphospho-undecaprenol 4-alpha-N-acetylgalactosaminyltransferase [Bremerella volcania]
MSSIPKPILIVTTELGMGGAERCVANVACGLNPSKFPVHVVALAPPPEDPKDALVRQLEDAQIPVTFLGCRTKWQLLSAVNRLKRIIQVNEVDAVWSFLFHANIVSAMATRGMSIRKLQSLRVIEQGSWRRRFQSWAAQRADRVLCVSEGVRQFAAKTLRVPESKLQVIPNGIDVDSIVPTTYAEPVDRKHRIVAVGRLDDQKGFDWLIFRLAQLLREKPEWELVIIGDGQLLPELLVQIESEDLNDSVRLVGWQDDLPSWFRESEIYALSSRWEGMPNALIEAMAHALPVIATDVEGVRELLSGELAVQKVNHWEMPEAEALLRRLIEDPALRQQLGQANRRQIETHFSLRQMIQSYETTLDDVLSGPSPKR